MLATVSVGIILLYLPNLNLVFDRFFISSTHGTWLKSPSGLESLYNMLWKFCNEPVVTVLAITIITIALISYFVSYRSSLSLVVKLLVFWFFFLFLFMFFVSYKIPMFSERYLMGAAIAFCLLLGFSVDFILQRPKYKFILPVILMVLFIATAQPNRSNKRMVKATIASLKNLKTNETDVLFCPQHFVLNFAYYYDLNLFKKLSDTKSETKLIASLEKQGVYGVYSIRELKKPLKNHVLFLDIDSKSIAPNNGIRSYLDANFRLVRKQHFYEVFDLYEYRRK